MRKIFLFLMIIPFLISSLNAESEPEYTKFTVLGNFYANYNLYNANFLNLPGYTSCCTEFYGGSGIAFGFGLGGEYLLKKDLLSGLSYRFSVAYSDFSGEISNEEVIGYDIDGNSYSDIVVDFAYDNKLPYVTTEHLAVLKLNNSLPFSLIAGLNIGIPLSATTDYKEELLKPNERYFENGEKIRNRQSGDINELNSLFFGVTAGVGYELYKSGGLSINPELLFTYGLTDIVNNVDWSASQFRGGITVKYNIPVAKPEPIKPQDPPKPILPEVPEPEEEPFLAMELTATINGSEIEDNQKIEFEYIRKIEKNVKNVVGVVFYNEQNAENEIKDIVSLLKQNNIKKIDLNIYSNEDKISEIFQSKIITNSFTIGKINKIIQSDNNIKYPKLAEESARIEILVKNQIFSGLLAQDAKSEIIIPQQKLKVNYNIESNSDVSNEALTLRYKDKKINLQKNADFLLDNLSISETNSFEIHLDTENQILTSKEIMYFSLIPVENKKETEINYNNLDNSQILAYSEFDKSAFYSVNNTLLDKAINYLQESPDNQIIISASTDNLGEAEYNNNLQDKRAKNAVRLFPKELHSQIEISNHPIQEFDNNMPSGRIKNRSVAIIFK